MSEDSIWNYEKLFKRFHNQLQKFSLSQDLFNKVLEIECEEIQFYRYNLDSYYSLSIYIDGSILLIKHQWLNYVINTDVFSLKTNDLLYLSSKETTLTNIFDIIVTLLMNKQIKPTKKILNILKSTFQFVPFDVEKYEYLIKNIKDQELIDQIRAKLFLCELAQRIPYIHINERTANYD